TGSGFGREDRSEDATVLGTADGNLPGWRVTRASLINWSLDISDAFYWLGPMFTSRRNWLHGCSRDENGTPGPSFEEGQPRRSSKTERYLRIGAAGAVRQHHATFD